MRLLEAERGKEIDLVIDPLDVDGLGLDHWFAAVIGILVGDPKDLMPLFGDAPDVADGEPGGVGAGRHAVRDFRLRVRSLTAGRAQQQNFSLLETVPHNAVGHAGDTGQVASFGLGQRCGTECRR